MIDEKLIDNVREHGTYSTDWQGKAKVLTDIGFPIGEKADYAIIMGCAQSGGDAKSDWIIEVPSGSPADQLYRPGQRILLRLVAFWPTGRDSEK